MIAKLNNRALVRFIGDESAEFLNDLITADTVQLDHGIVRPSALLTPQGRVLFDLLISADDHGITIELDADRRDIFIKKMTMYRMRRAIEITADDRPVFAIINTPNEGPDGGLTDCRFEAVQDNKIQRYYGEGLIADADDEAWKGFRYRHGVAEGQGDLPPEKALPLEARLDLNQGISFDKGCYIGQEVTARTRYRGLIKRCYLPVRIAGDVTTPCDLEQNGKNAGQLLGACLDQDGWLGLASLRLEALDQGADITAAGQVITPIYPERIMPLPAKKD